MQRGMINGALGLAAVGVPVVGILTSLSGLPEYNPRLRFISELAVPWNPSADRVNESFMIGGVLLALFAIAVATTPGAVRDRAARVSCAAAGLTGLALIMVGAFPLTRPVPHLVAALILGIGAITAAIASSRVVRRAARARPQRGGLVLAHAVTLAMWSLAAMVLAGIGYFVVVCTRAGVGSMDELFRVLPHHLPMQIGGTWYNPLAVLEWGFFAVLSIMLLGAALAESTGTAARLRGR
ncbi:MAG TPA: DUF998 domain-containing protein [Kofleriaceae bacterium]|nr:DUF998 domain-containing protein [Kofleriaceae bacterium]